MSDHDFSASAVCGRCGISLKALREARRQPRLVWSRYGVEIYAGSWFARLDWGPGRFGWLEGQNALIRFVRRWWSGWHRWDECDPL